MSDITREEAIKILKDTLYDERTPNNYIQAVRMGREALENQKSLQEKLEDIIKEIEAIKDFEVINGGLYVRQYEAVKILEKHKKQAEEFGKYINKIEKELENEK